MKHIKKFENDSKYTNFRFGENYVTPNIYLVGDTLKSHKLGADYYKNKYFTITALNDNSILHFDRSSYQGISLELYKEIPENCYIKFSRDNGKTWITVPREYNSNYWYRENESDSDDSIRLQITFNMNAGDSVMFSINSAARNGYYEYDNDPRILTFDDDDPFYGTFNCYNYNTYAGILDNMSFEVSGNILSLFFGDRFNNLNEDDIYVLNSLLLSDASIAYRPLAYLFYGLNLISAKNLVIPYPIHLRRMFYGNDTLAEGPQLISTDVVNDCYAEMYVPWEGMPMKDITLYALCTPEQLYYAITATFSDDTQKFWEENMTTNGITLHKHPKMTIPATVEIDGETKQLLPSGWTVVDID